MHADYSQHTVEKAKNEAKENLIVLFTDFGLIGPYVGQMKAVIHSITPKTKIIDLMHDAPKFNPKFSSYLLAAYSQHFELGTIFVAVVDPEVGGDRHPIVVQADGKWFVGPDNGLFEMVCRHAQTVKAWKIKWRPRSLSVSFHGRDIFAPVAARIANGDMPASEALDEDFIREPKWPDDLQLILYIDHFGNAVTGLRSSFLNPKSILKFGKYGVSGARVFSDVTQGEYFWYENANGLVEIAVNKGRASALGIEIGTPISVSMNY